MKHIVSTLVVAIGTLSSKANAAAPVSASTAAPVSASTATAPAEAAAPPKQLATGADGKGFVQPSILLQSWLYASRQSVEPPAEDKSLGFRIRRAELKLKGDIVPERFGYQLVIDAARALEPSSASVPASDGSDINVPQANGPLTLLTDASVCFCTEYADISVGQFRIPLSYEGVNSSSKILFPERAAVARYYGDKRDMGIRIEKKFEYVGYMLGVFNGSGQNKLDTDRDKDVGLRLEGYPIKGLTVAGVGYATIGTRDKTTRDRVEADLRYEGYSALVLLEHIRGWDRKNNAKAVRGHGTYVQAAYTLFGVLQPMVRIGDLEPNMDKSGDHFWHYEGGLAWLFLKNEAKVTLSASVFDPTHTDHKQNVLKTEGILAVQASF